MEPDKKFEINHVSDTALWVAAYRALETNRKDALFSDPLAHKLLNSKSHDISKQMQGSKYTSWMISIRTCIIDRFILSQIENGVDTILNLGAGLDTRPYRLDLPSDLRWIEVDFQNIVDYKNQILSKEAPHCRLERIQLDLSDSKSRNEFFNSINIQSKKVLVLTEGVITYLNCDEVAQLCDDLILYNNFKYWIVDYFSPLFLNEIKRKKYTKQMKNAPIQFFPTNWFEFFENKNWFVKDISYLDDESQKLKRKMPKSFWLNLFKFLLPKSKKSIFKHFAGFAILTPSRLSEGV